jgi:hypothetical protein
VLLRSSSGSYKITTIGNQQGMLNVIQHALTIANFAIDYPVLLEINHKIAVMGGGAILILSKIWTLFVCCLSVFLGDLRAKKSLVSCPKKILGGKPLYQTP